MSTGRPTTRKERRKRIRENYLVGRSSRPYHHTPTLRRSLEEGSEAGPSTEACSRCHPVLQRYKPQFDQLVQQGSALKKRKKQHPHVKRLQTSPYRDLNVQNVWLRNNIFDSMGNYLFCGECVRKMFHVSSQRLSRQRRIKQSQNQEPTKEMKKSEVEQERLSDYVVMPQDCEINFLVWWRSLNDDDKVTVRYPHERHGNAGKPSHAAKTSVMEDFLQFVDCNSQPNGRSADSSGPTSYFISKFTCIQTPKRDVHNYSERLTRSVVGEFNGVQEERGRGKCSNGSASNWLKKHRPKVAICPHKQDYCDSCAMVQ